MNIFISHASLDKAIARRIADVLETEGQKVFFDQKSIPTGAVLSREIKRALKQSDLAIFLLTKNVERSKFVEAEVSAILRNENERRVIPILIGDKADENAIWPVLADRNAILAGDEFGDDDLRNLTRMVREWDAVKSIRAEYETVALN
jgi:hypothetical protein